MQITGNIRKMTVEHESPINYSLPVGDEQLALNPVIGKKIEMDFQGQINCIHCNRRTNKSYHQGFCYPCMQTLAQCDMCILKPETCHFHKGTCREPQWGETHCMIDHYVYLANSSGVKVGITRHSQVPTRWIDQGAVAAIPLVRVNRRIDSGLLEVALKEKFNDKTNWRNMLKNLVPEIDLNEEKTNTLSLLQDLLGDYPDAEIAEDRVYEFNYPVLEYPKVVKSHSFDKTPNIEGTLQGIKGQYLLLDTGVLNMRKHSGYKLDIKVEE